VANGYINRDQFPEVLGVATIAIPGSAERNYQLIGFSDFFYHYTERLLLKTARIIVKAYGIVEPRFENYVSLDPLKRDAYGVPLLNIQFSHSDKDRALLHEMYESLLAFSTTMGLSLESPPLMSPTGYDNHECGTCRMGDNPATSVTNRFGQVHGISGLYIADNSVVNLSSPANPTLTTIALAMRTADYIISQMK
jgi:choline dehydrogenase-like flavoprotein